MVEVTEADKRASPDKSRGTERLCGQQTYKISERNNLAQIAKKAHVNKLHLYLIKAEPITPMTSKEQKKEL